MSTRAIIVLILLCGCAHRAAPRVVPADEARGLRLHAENLKDPAIGMLGDSEIRTLLQDNVGPEGQADGIAFGVVDQQGVRVVSAGTFGNDTGRNVDGDTVFRIGSITKVFTAILLQEMVDRGEMKLDDPVQKYLPASVKMPTRNGKHITLFDLATHTSGLPRDGDGRDPQHLYAFLSRCRLTRDPGSQWEYSNLGVGLLGHVIALKAGKDYEALVVQRICDPLGMSSTRITLTPELRARAARPNAYPGWPLADTEWHGPLEGCGAFRSTANDLLKFLAANLGLTSSELTPLLNRASALHKLPSGREGRLVWMEDAGIICHGGQVDGFLSDIAFDPSQQRGVVSLANCTNSRIRVVWKPLLNRQSPKPARTVPIDPMMLDFYVGTYQRGEESAVVVRRDGDRLLFQWWHGHPWYSLPLVRTEGFAESETVFYNQLWADPVIFDRDSSGRVSGLRLKEAAWTRVSDQPAARSRLRFDAAVYERFVGQYRHVLFGLIPVGPTLNVFVRKDGLGTHLMGYVPRMGCEELYPAANATVITPDLDGAWITFSSRLNRAGKAIGALVHINGKDVSAARVSDRPQMPGGD